MLSRFLSKKGLPIHIDIINSCDYSKFTDTILDIQPLSVKVSGKIGKG
jgi:hypothetical protein